MGVVAPKRHRSDFADTTQFINMGKFWRAEDHRLVAMGRKPDGEVAHVLSDPSIGRFDDERNSCHSHTFNQIYPP